MRSDQFSSDLHHPTLSYYNANAQRYFEDTHEIDMRSLYEPFLSLLPPRAHILDAGCGSGRDSLFFLKNGYEVTSFDASQAMVEQASRHTNRPVLRLSFHQLEFTERFDGVWACASLLHVPRHAIGAAFLLLSTSLKIGGFLYASFKYGNGEAIRNGRLFNDYNEETFSRLLRPHSELEIVRLWRTVDLRPDQDNVTWLTIIRWITGPRCKRVACVYELSHACPSLSASRLLGSLWSLSSSAWADSWLPKLAQSYWSSCAKAGVVWLNVCS
jgi:SAM-dependent methyltransferase